LNGETSDNAARLCGEVKDKDGKDGNAGEARKDSVGSEGMTMNELVK
jgi:hypothetical protein